MGNLKSKILVLILISCGMIGGCNVVQKDLPISFEISKGPDLGIAIVKPFAWNGSNLCKLGAKNSLTVRLINNTDTKILVKDLPIIAEITRLEIFNKEGDACIYNYVDPFKVGVSLYDTLAFPREFVLLSERNKVYGKYISDSSMIEKEIEFSLPVKEEFEWTLSDEEKLILNGELKGRFTLRFDFRYLVFGSNKISKKTFEKTVDFKIKE